MRAAAWLVLLLGVLALVATVVLWIAAIWTVGPDSARLGSTGGVMSLVGLGLTFAGGLAVDTTRGRR